MGFEIRPAADGELEACARLMSGSEPWLTLRLGYVVPGHSELLLRKTVGSLSGFRSAQRP